MSTEVMDIVTASESVNEWIEKSGREPCRKVFQLTLWTDQAVDFKSRMKTIGSSAAMGLVLVMIVLLLT